MKFPFPAVVALLSAGSCFAQKTVEVSYARDAKGAIVFTGVNHAFCTYIVSVNFSAIENGRPDKTLPYFAEIKPGTGKLFTLLPVDPAQPIQFKYGTGYTKGCLFGRADTGFVYLLPVAPGREVQAYEMQSAPAAANMPDNHWYSIRLKMKNGDTIYAARSGVVTEVSVGDSANDAGLPLKTENYVELVHADCSYGQYSILRSDGALVKPGDKVRTGDPVGIVGGDKFGRGSEIRFSVSYYREETVSGNGTGNVAGHMRYVPLLFWTKTNGKGKLTNGSHYTAEAPAAIVQSEQPRAAPRKKTSGKKKSNGK